MTIVASSLLRNSCIRGQETGTVRTGSQRSPREADMFASGTWCTGLTHQVHCRMGKGCVSFSTLVHMYVHDYRRVRRLLNERLLPYNVFNLMSTTRSPSWSTCNT